MKSANQYRIATEVPLEVVSEQMGLASIRVTKDVYGHLMPGSRVRTAEAMRSVLFSDFVSESPETSDPLAVNLAVIHNFSRTRKSLTSTFVGRPGLDPGTLGLKVPCSSR